MADFKRMLRRQMRALRSAIPAEERQRLSLLIDGHAVKAVQPGMCVMAYIPSGSEVDTQPLIDALWSMDCRVCVPHAVGQGKMRAVMYRPGDALVPDACGIPAPVDGATVPPEAIDIVFVPGLAFDRGGRRLGYGGGYYDRFLPNTAARRIALAYSAQLTDALPCEEWDAPVDAVADEYGFHIVT